MIFITSSNHDKSNDDQGMESRDTRFKWELLPLEVYETLVQHLDGFSLINLCLTSPYLTDRVLEPFSTFSHQRREIHWNRFCLETLDHHTIGKIFTSFMTRKSLGKLTEKLEADDGGNNKGSCCLASWEDVFKSYLSYWRVAVNGLAVNRRLKLFENKLKAEILFSIASRDHEYGRALKWVTCSGGGENIVNVLQPSPPESLRHINTVIAEVSENVTCLHTPLLCSNANVFFGLKIFYYPIKRDQNGTSVLEFDRVVLTACNNCIAVTPLFGFVTRSLPMPWPDEKDEYDRIPFIQFCPVFEMLNNVLVVWPLPQSLRFLLFFDAAEQGGYDYCLLYKLRFDEETGDALQKKLKNHPSRYLFDVQEVEGHNATMREDARKRLMGESGYFYPPQKPVHYCLAIISPIEGMELLKPAKSNDGYAIVENFEARYYKNNCKKYLPLMQGGDPTCSGKGHGIFVFCRNLIIAASWDGITWIFGQLSLDTIKPTMENAENVVTHVQVADRNHGLLLIVNEDIILADMGRTFPTDEMGRSCGPEIDVRPMRVFQTNLASMCKEITHLELNFDNGRPFLLVVARGKAKEVEFVYETGYKTTRIREDEYGFAVMRIDFE